MKINCSNSCHSIVVLHVLFSPVSDNLLKPLFHTLQNSKRILKVQKMKEFFRRLLSCSQHTAACSWKTHAIHLRGTEAWNILILITIYYNALAPCFLTKNVCVCSFFLWKKIAWKVEAQICVSYFPSLISLSLLWRSSSFHLLNDSEFLCLSLFFFVFHFHYLLFRCGKRGEKCEKIKSKELFFSTFNLSDVFIMRWRRNEKTENLLKFH